MTEGDDDLPALLGVLDGIGDEVLKDAFQLAPVGVDLGGGDVPHLVGDVLSLGEGLVFPQHRTQKSAGVHLLFEGVDLVYLVF